MFKRIAGLLILLGMASPVVAQVDVSAIPPEQLLILDVDYNTGKGRVVIMMYDQVAPNHVSRIKELARTGFYDGILFHRVIPGFMAQTGDPDGDGTGGSGQNLDAEFSRLPHLRGTVSMARAEDENSADSQFFICYNRATALDNKYTVWGRVISGMEHVDPMPPGEPPAAPGKIISVRVAADVDNWPQTTLPQEAS